MEINYGFATVKLDETSAALLVEVIDLEGSKTVIFLDDSERDFSLEDFRSEYPNAEWTVATSF